MNKFRRILKAGIINFRRGGSISFASVLVMIVTLSVVMSLMLLQAVLSSSLNDVKDKVDVTIYFVPGASEDQILPLKASLEQLPEVASVSYTTDREALEQFRARHEGDYATLAALDEIKTNPLGAYLSVKAKDVSQYENIANFLKSDNALISGSASVIDKINYHQNKEVIDRLANLIRDSQRLGFILTLFFVVISIIITYNTIRLTIFISREEIGVMRLVGASRGRVRGPFVVSGAICAIVATLITLVLFWPITAWFGRTMTGYLGLDLYGYFLSNLLSLGSIVLLSGMLLGMISSYIAVHKYLNK